MDRITKRRLWEQRIADFKNSGQTARAWCKAHGLHIDTFRYWLNKAGKDGIIPKLKKQLKILWKTSKTNA